MLDKLKNLADKATNAVSSAAVMVGDLNGDGKVDEEDARIAAAWAKGKASSIGEEASRLGQEAMRSDLAKDAASGAAIGAVVAIPVPLIGPPVGAAIGAALGVYRNFTKPNQPAPVVIDRMVQTDIHAELLKLDDLRLKGLISDSEFEAQKKKILDGKA